MDIIDEIEIDKHYENVRLKLRKGRGNQEIVDSLKDQGLSELQANSIYNTALLTKKSIVSGNRFAIILCSIIAAAGIFLFALVPHGFGAGFLNYILFSIMITMPLLISYAMNHGYITLEFKHIRTKVYFGYMAYLVLMLAYLIYYKFSQDRHIWEALLFILTALDFRTLFEVSNDLKFESPQYFLEIKAYQGEQKKYKIFKRITFTSSMILVYILVISSKTAVAGLSYVPFGIAAVSIYWIILSLIETNQYRKLW